MHGPDGPARTSQKKYVVEKIRMMAPDIAVVQVSSTSAANLGTYLCRSRRVGG